MNNLITKELALILRLFPMIASSALLLKNKISNIDIAATDGITLFLGKGFFKENQKNKLGILLHEYLHTALAHPERAGLLKLKYKEKFDMKTLNIAADAIINQVIYHQELLYNNVSLPEGCIRYNEITKHIKNIWPVNIQIPASQYMNIEKLYDILIEAKSHSQDILNNQLEGTSADLSKELSSDKSDDKENINKINSAKYIDKILKEESDLIPKEGKFDDLNKEIVKKSQDIKNNISQYSKFGDNIFEKLTYDIPNPQHNWKKHFRFVISKLISQNRPKNNMKPSNSMISKLTQNNNIIWEAGRKRSKNKKIIVIADTSASIKIDEFKKFIAETEAMRKTKNLSLYYACADTEIKDIVKIEKANDYKKINFVGRGGTCFIQPLKYAQDNDFDLAIYMTDMEGQFPDKCKIATIWVSTSSNISPPFGKLITLN